MDTRLFHFSDRNSIELFKPRAVSVPAQRAKGFEWLNGPLVWAIDAWHQPMYLFPRECPRILVWRTAESRVLDVDTYFGSSDARMLAYVETDWLPRIASEAIYRYDLPITSFQALHDAGMWVSCDPVTPLQMTEITNLPSSLLSEGVELRSLDVLSPLRDLWATSLHASGIRLRNAQGWSF